MHGIDFNAFDWLRFAPTFLWIQLVAAGAWLGAILCVRSLSNRSRYMADAEEIARLACGLYARFTWFFLVVSAGAALARAIPAREALLHDRPLLVTSAVAVAMLFAQIAVGIGARRARLAALRAHDDATYEPVPAERWSEGSLSFVE